MSTETIHDDDRHSTVEDPQEPSSGPQRTKARRAVQACSNCRKHKLRCLGGWPCNRCEKQKITCDFDRPGHPIAAKATETIERLEQLEASVTSILASMSSSLAPNPQIHTPRQHSVVSDVGSYHAPAAFHPQPAASYPFQVEGLPSPFPPSGSTGAGSSFTPSSPPREYSQLMSSGPQLAPPPEPEFLSVPTQDLDPPGPPVASTSQTQISPPTVNVTEPSTAAHTASPTASSLASRPSRRAEPPPSGESRLQAIADPYSAPFKGVLHQPSVWNNSEQSRRPSLEPAEEEGEGVEVIEVDKGDPIGAGIITREVAIELFNFFAGQCHSFLPVVDVSQRDAYDSIRHKSPFLFSTILAIAARFASDASANPARLATLAESHLSQTLLRKQHCLSDVQATLLLAGWGLQPGGGGPDAWLLTGHATRMGRRLGLWRAPKPANANEDEKGERRLGYIQRWRTWMCLFAYDRCLSLGFGRPASHFENESIDAGAFVRECVARASLPSSPSFGSNSTNSATMSTGDFFIASQVQLMLIGRDLCAWFESVRDRGSPSWSWEMVKEMNDRLDKWSRDWTWSSSPYLPYLNSSTRTARMYCEHVRLCLNSLALRASPTPAESGGEVVGRYLEKALNSATAIIQMHHDAATTDGGLSFCIDYLTIVLATAAVFLIRLVRAQTQTRLLDSGVAIHYLKMAVGALEKSETSQTRLSTHLAKTIREMARAAGFTEAFPHSESSPQRDPDDAHNMHGFPAADEFNQIPLDSTFEALLAFPNQVDPSYIGFLFGEETGVDMYTTWPLLPRDLEFAFALGTSSLGNPEGIHGITQHRRSRGSCGGGENFSDERRPVYIPHGTPAFLPQPPLPHTMRSLTNFFKNEEAANSPPEIFNFRIYLLGFTSALGGATFGWDTGFIGGAVGLQGFKDRFNTGAATSAVTANVVATLQAGCFFGSLAAAPLATMFGRRIAMHIFLVLFQIGTILQLLPGGSLALMYAGRVITGLGVGAISVLNPMYISECSPRAIRGRMTSTVNLVIVTALTLAFFVNLIAANHLTGDVQWRVPFALPMIPAGLMQIGMLFQPESPRWLVSKDRTEEARNVLVRIRKLPPTHPYIAEELQHVRTQLDAERAATEGVSTFGLFKEIATHTPSRRVFVVGCFLQLAQQLTGTNSINYYSPLIFKLIGFTGGTTALLATGVYGIVKVVTTIFYVIFLIDQIGRRRPLIVGGTIQALCLLVLFFISRFDPLPSTPVDGVTPSGYASAVMIYVYAFGWSFGFSVAPWVLAAEIFPTRLRALCFSTVIALQWGLNFMITRVTPLMIEAMGIKYVFLFFSLCTFSTVGIIYFVVPETKGFPLEAMNALFSFGWVHTKDLRARALADHKRENEAAAAEATQENSSVDDVKVDDRQYERA